MISFYPGPSKIDESVPGFVMEAAQKGILSINHRSEAFIEISKFAVEQLKSKLEIPDDYLIAFVSSATECWEIIAQSLIKESSLHYYNGAFGEKWHEYTKKIKPNTQAIPYAFDTIIPLEKGRDNSADLICITQNETSNGTAVGMEQLKILRRQNPQALLAIDATSSLAGVHLDISLGDVWYSSVQKCLGLPAGMAVLILSPAAVKRAEEVGENMHYNSLLSIIEKAKIFQTTYTPNVLNIFLLGKVLDSRPSISIIHKKLEERYHSLYSFWGIFSQFKPLVQDKTIQSKTVLAVQTSTALLDHVKKTALKHDLLLGNGYGTWKNSTFRIANFPSISDNEMNLLYAFFKEHFL